MTETTAITRHTVLTIGGNQDVCAVYFCLLCSDCCAFCSKSCPVPKSAVCAKSPSACTLNDLAISSIYARNILAERRLLFRLSRSSRVIR